LVVARKSSSPHSPPSELEDFFILPKVLSFYLCCSPYWSILLVRKPGRRSTSLIPGGVPHTFALLPKLERPGSPQIGLQGGSLGGYHASFCLLKAGLLFEPGFLPV
jgi:hypothetical protein